MGHGTLTQDSQPFGRQEETSGQKEEHFRDFLFEYQYDGSAWTFKLPASSFKDAERRLARIRLGGKLLGEHVATIPACGGPFVKLACWIRSFFI